MGNLDGLTGGTEKSQRTVSWELFICLTSAKEKREKKKCLTSAVETGIQGMILALAEEFN